MEQEIIELIFLFIGMFIGTLIGYLIGSRIGILNNWSDLWYAFFPKRHIRTVSYPEPGPLDKRPDGAKRKQPAVQPIIIEIKDKNKHTIGAYIENWQEVIMNLTQEQNERTKGNKP